MEVERNKGERLARIEGIVEQMNERLNHLGSEITELRRTMLFILIPMWVTIILGILGLFFKK